MSQLLDKLFSLFRKSAQSKVDHFQIYRRGIVPDDSKIMVFRNADEVEIFKCEQEIRELEAKLKEIDSFLGPIERKIREQHRKLWNY